MRKKVVTKWLYKYHFSRIYRKKVGYEWEVYTMNQNEKIKIKKLDRHAATEERGYKWKDISSYGRDRVSSV